MPSSDPSDGRHRLRVHPSGIQHRGRPRSGDRFQQFHGIEPSPGPSRARFARHVLCQRF